MAELLSRKACPACGTQAPRHLDEISKDAVVDFFECVSCHHLWTVNKFDASKMTHITRLLRPKKSQQSA